MGPFEFFPDFMSGGKYKPKGVPFRPLFFSEFEKIILSFVLPSFAYVFMFSTEAMMLITMNVKRLAAYSKNKI